MSFNVRNFDSRLNMFSDSEYSVSTVVWVELHVLETFQVPFQVLQISAFSGAPNIRNGGELVCSAVWVLHNSFCTTVYHDSD